MPLPLVVSVLLSTVGAGALDPACPAVYFPAASQSALGGGNLAHLPNRTLSACLEACCTNPQCLGIDYKNGASGAGLDCWLHRELVTEPIRKGQPRTSAVLCRAAGPNCTLPAPFAPTPSPGPLKISFTSGNLGMRFDGIGGLAAVGGARLLYEYPEPTRGKILDLLFDPSAGGALYHILKVEIEGDIDSSYGSGPSYKHTADPASVSFNRGIYLPWLIKEAKRRQPEIKLYALSWGLPNWVGHVNGSTAGVLSCQGVKYHTDYLAGAKAEHGISFDYVGIWNESPWTRSYIKELRSALDDQGMGKTQIVVPDGSARGCLDCQEFGSDDITVALERDKQLTGAVDIIGIHGHDVEGTAGAPGWQNITSINPRGLRLWNSEQNLIDGPLPQWDPTEQNKYGAGLGWPRIFITNYVRAGATATILCPITHSFTWNYGRQNHGHSQFVEPWSGHFGLGAAFWSQAHFTQFTRPGWHFLGGDGAGERCHPEDSKRCDTVWAALTDMPKEAALPATVNRGNLSLVFVHTANNSVEVALSLGEGFEQGGRTLARWQTVKSRYFQQVESVRVGVGGTVNLTLPGRSVTTLTTLTAAGKHADVSWNPPRKQFPLPWFANFDDQPVGAPGAMLSDVYGAFEVARAGDLASSEKASEGRTEEARNRGMGDNVLWQSVPTDPGHNAWSHFTHIHRSPFTSLPSGTNWMNYAFSVRAKLLGPSVSTSTVGPLGESDAVVVCGRVPVWKPGGGSPTVRTSIGNLTVPFGICLTVSRSGPWFLTEAVGSTTGSVIASGKTIAATNISTWQTIELQFSGYEVTAWIGGKKLSGAGPAQVTLGSGVAGFGSSWVNAIFDDIALTRQSGAAMPSGSFLFDCLPGQRLINVTGWAGMVVEAKVPVTIAQLGRYKTRGNSQMHAMQVFRASDGVPMLAKSSNALVDMACDGDVLGMCYTPTIVPPVRLAADERYYIVAAENAHSGDMVTEMGDSARMTTHAHRDGSTIMSYLGPGVLDVVGRVTKTEVLNEGIEEQSSWQVTPELDTSFGPVNAVLAP